MDCNIDRLYCRSNEQRAPPQHAGSDTYTLNGSAHCPFTNRLSYWVGQHIAHLCHAAAESGVDGVLLSGLRPDDAEQLRTIGTNLGRLARE